LTAWHVRRRKSLQKGDGSTLAVTELVFWLAVLPAENGAARGGALRRGCVVEV
jgi:hypothetical protein